MTPSGALRRKISDTYGSYLTKCICLKICFCFFDFVMLFNNYLTKAGLLISYSKDLQTKKDIQSPKYDCKEIRLTALNVYQGLMSQSIMKGTEA